MNKCEFQHDINEGIIMTTIQIDHTEENKVLQRRIDELETINMKIIM